MTVAHPLTGRGKVMFDDLPPLYDNDETVAAILQAMGNEFQRIEDAANVIRRGMFPQSADDTYGLLSLWETLLGLPVAAAGVGVAARQANVLARLRGRGSGAGADWVATLTSLIGTGWNYQEGPGDYVVTIYLPFAAGGDASIRAQNLARAITPAHLDIAVVFDEGFLVGEGRIGEDRF
jgi:hypothetical protein